MFFRLFIMWQIWIDTGGTFTDGMAQSPGGKLHRIKVLSSARLRGQWTNGRLSAPWRSLKIFEGYRVRVLQTGQEAVVAGLAHDGQLTLNPPIELSEGATLELSTGEEAPVLAARLLTQTPLNQPFPALKMRLGTTRGTNALLERRGGRVALLVTKGFRDLLKIGTQQRPHLFQLAIPPADVLYEDVFEVEERVSADGQVIHALRPDSLQKLIQALQTGQYDAIAVSLLNAYCNPIHEKILKQTLEASGISPVTLSTDVSTSPGYLARTQTAVVDAYLMPVLKTYLDNIRTQLSGGGANRQTVRVMTSAGGLVRSELFRPKDSLLSGPAGGVIGAGHTGGGGRLLTLDMGGTSTDVARLENGRPDYRFTTRIGPFELQLPSLAIETVAAGGGSVCWFDAAFGQLRVGPQSAGASPGPACYGATGPDQPLLMTITDVNLLLHKLHPSQFSIPIFYEKAQQALEALLHTIEEHTGKKPDETAILRGLERIADEAMAGAIRKISVQRGFDPAHYPLLVFGGAGGLHACQVARLLGIDTVILPYDGGLLSAYGIGQARIERGASLSILQTLDLVEPGLSARFDDLVRQAGDALRQDVGPDTPLETLSERIFLRLKGQEATLDVVYREKNYLDEIVYTDLRVVFQEQYRKLYGYLPQEETIEVESIRVVVCPAPGPLKRRNEQPGSRDIEPTFYLGEYPVYDWSSLRHGDGFLGPALLINPTSSAFIDKDWAVSLYQDKRVSIYRINKENRPDSLQENVVQAELFTRRFMAIAEEMGAQLQRTAFSTNVKERLDFSCALLDAQAELVANAPHIPVHLGSLGVCARLCLEKLGPLRPGDVVITNHPKYGGSHLPDVTLLQGVFTEKNELIGYVINRAHHAEIGGKVPGSMPPDAVCLAEEGVVLEPMFLVREGQSLWESEIAKRFRQAAYPTRALAENKADIEAALASLRAGELALKDLVRQEGLQTVHHYMNGLKQAAARTIEAVLKRHADRTFEAEESLDDGHWIRVRISVRQERIQFDFTGTSGVHPNNLNANTSILYSAILYVLRLWVDQDIPLNEGLMAPVDLILPQTSFLNPHFPDDPEQCPAVVGGNTEVSQRLVDTLLKALGLAACSQGTMNNFLFGTSGEASDAFGYYETIGGGAGATPDADGRSAVHQHMTNTRLTDPEELERRYPVRLHEFAIRAGSGGSGRRRGGDGIIREIEFLEPVQATLLSQHRNVRPYGMAGGEPGQPGRQTLILANGETEPLPGIFTRPMQPGERIRIETPGGGGMSERAKE